MSSTRGGRKTVKPAGTKPQSPATRPAASRRAPLSHRRMRRLRGWLLRVAFLGLGFAIVVLGWAAIARNSAPTANTDRTRFDALIVLGDPADADGNPTPKQLARVNEAVREYERGVAPHIILTGGAVRSRFVEAEVMARAAQAEGIPSSAIVIEGKALDTIQNLCYSTRILQQKGWSSAEIISSASHLPRTALIAEEMPIEWRTHPAPPLTPAVGSRLMFAEAIEELKTVHFLLWARLRERCQP